MSGRPRLLTRVVLLAVGVGASAWLVLDRSGGSDSFGPRETGDRFAPRVQVSAGNDAPELAPVAPTATASRASEAIRTEAAVPDPTPRPESPGSTETPDRIAATRAARTKRRVAAGLPALRADHAAEDGVEWLVRHQENDGRWDADGFGANGEFRWPETARGAPDADLRVTSLALLALLEDGHSMTRGEHKDPVKRATRWLVGRQDRETGRWGEREGLSGIVDHALTTLVFGEIFDADKAVLVLGKQKRALRFLEEEAGTHAAHLAALGARSDDRVRESWAHHVERMRAYSSPDTRRAMRLDAAGACGTLEWRWVIHTHFGGSSDAQDVFASYSVQSLLLSSDARIEAWSEELHRTQLAKGDARGAFLSSDPRHREIGAVGTTALSVIALAAVADRLDETRDDERWKR
ncbi:MAG: hypothetical protein AAGB93_04525 [Planctomycetota bacterium]